MGGLQYHVGPIAKRSAYNCLVPALVPFQLGSNLYPFLYQRGGSASHYLLQR
jgi:hypothetical protein